MTTCLLTLRQPFLFLRFIFIHSVNIDKVFWVILLTSCLIEVNGINDSIAAGESSKPITS